MGLTSLRSSSKKKEQSKSYKRKLEKKQDFYTKVKDAIVSLGAKKQISKKKILRSRQKKLKAYDLSALSEVLANLNAPKQLSDVTNLNLNCKSRQKLVQKESAQLRAVLNHPAFQTDPFAAIRQHIESTQLPPVEGKQRQSHTNKKKAKTKTAKGSMSSSQAMDF